MRTAVTSLTILVVWAQISVLAEEPPAEDPGIFPIYEFKGPGAKIKGTATFIDREYGWLLTAAHVVKRCDCKSLTGSVYIKPRFVITGALKSVTVEAWVECSIMAYGHDFIGNPEPEGNTNDWVVLRIKNPESLTCLRLFTVYTLAADETPPSLSDIAKLRPADWNGHIYGFPDGNEALTPEPADLACLSEKGSGLWQISSHVSPGNSGGPFANRATVLGITLRVAQTQSGSNVEYQSDMLPTYSFLPRIAHQLTNTVRVSNVLRFGELAALSEDQLLTIFADLLEFNSVEHYQLLQSLCRFSPGTLKEFVMDVYSAYFIRQNWVLRRLMSCLPEASVNALGGGAHRIATNAQNATMPTQAFRDSLSLAHEITTFISSRRDSLPQGEANVEMVAQAVVDEVVLRRRLLGPAGDTGQDSANLDWAESRLPESTEVGALRLELASSWLSQTNYTWQRRVETSVNNSVHPLVITGTTQVGGRLGNALTFVSASSIKGLTQAARLGDKVAIKSPTYDWRLAGTFPGDQGVLVDSVFEELITPAEQASNIIASTEGIRRVDDGYFGDVDSTYAGEQLGLTNVINPSGSLHFELSGGQLSKYTLKLRGTILGSNGGLDEIGKTMTVNILEGSTNLKLPKAAYMKLAE